MVHNEMSVRFCALSQNESFARVAAGAFASQLSLTMNELADIKTAVSEAVTNAIIHGYGDGVGWVTLTVRLADDDVFIQVKDEGRGIDDIERARQPFFSTADSQERSGMGFTVMEAFMDELTVTSAPGMGTTVCMRKHIGAQV